jgi:hypothetical protein
MKMDLREIGWGGGVEWIHLAQDRDHWRAVVNAVMNLQVLVPWSWFGMKHYAIGGSHLSVIQSDMKL